MIFRNFEPNLLGSKAKLKIALHFLSGRGPSGERELSRALGLSHVAISKSLEEMELTNLLRKTRIGSSNVWSLNEESYAYSCLRDLKKLALGPPLLHLKGELESDFGSDKLAKKVAIFGSVAEGRETAASDIDVFILTDKASSKKLIVKKIDEISGRYSGLYGNNLSAFILAEKENKNKNLAENIKRGILVK